MMEIGDTLREARSSRGLSLKDAEESTKIRSKYLQALEQDDFAVIPGPAFVKGFLRTYADYLDVDGDLLVHEYRTRFEPVQDTQPVLRTPVAGTAVRRRPPRRIEPLQVAFLVLLVALVAVLLWFAWTRIFDGGDQGSEPSSTSVTQTGSTVGSAAPASTTPATATTGTVAAAATASTLAALTAEPTPGQAGDGQGTRLVISAMGGGSWLIVREGSAEGRTLFTGTLAPGKRLEYILPGDAWLNVGAPSSLRLTIDGKETPVPEPYGNFLVSAGELTRLP